MSSRFLPLSLPLIGLYSGMIGLILLVTGHDSLAQRLSKQSNPNLSQNVIAAGTRIPVRSLNLERILLTEQETVSIGLIISADLYNRQGKITIPSGSQIKGEIKPVEEGVQFLSYHVQVEDQVYPIQALSQVIHRRQTIESQDDLVKLGDNILIGEEASQAIAALMNQNTSHGNLRELAQWLLGHLSIDLMLIYPNQDLTLTLQSDFRLEPNSSY